MRQHIFIGIVSALFMVGNADLASASDDNDGLGVMLVASERSAFFRSKPCSLRCASPCRVTLSASSSNEKKGCGYTRLR